MSNLPPELRERMIKSLEGRERIETPLGFILYPDSVFYGEYPLIVYCGKREDYQSFIDNIDSIKEKYLENKKSKSLGFSGSIFG